MLCRKNIIIGSGIFLPVLLSVLFVSPSYATDITYTMDSSHGSKQNFCYDTTCQGMSYLIIESSSDFVNSSFYFTLTFQNSSNNFSWSSELSPYLISSNPFIMPLPALTRLNLGAVNIASIGSNSITFTLTDTLPSSCPDPDPCPSCPTCPAVPDTPYGDQLDNITRAIYVCAGVLLVLYFFYCIYRMLIRSSGVEK